MEVSRINTKNPATCQLNPKHQPSLHRKRKDLVSPKVKYDIRKGFGVDSQNLRLNLRKGSEPIPRLGPPAKMLFNTDPLNLAALCSEPDGTKPRVAQPEVSEKKLYSDATTFKCADVKDPLKLNDLIVNNEKDQQKIIKKKRWRKRRYTETDAMIFESNRRFTLDNEVFQTGKNEKDSLKNITLSNMVGKTVSDETRKLKILTSRDKMNQNPQHKYKLKYKDNNFRFRYGCVDNYGNLGESKIQEIVNQKLSLLKKEWFYDLKCLDVGCNSGHVTCWIAKYFQPQLIKGVDIDHRLIQTARMKTINHYVFHPHAQRFPSSFSQIYGPLGIMNAKHAMENLEFSVENYVPANSDSLNYIKPVYDVILCLRVTKWIHLNHGDAGLKYAFRKMYLQLNNGGKLFIEFQQHHSYKKHKNRTPEMNTHFTNMKLMPTDFISYLLSPDVGFSQSECLGYTKTKAGPALPLYMLTKRQKVNVSPENGTNQKDT